MTKKQCKLYITLTAVSVLVAAIIAVIFLSRVFPSATFTGTIPEGVSKQQAITATITKSDYKIAKQAQNTNEDEATRNALIAESLR